jgi:metal-responsive CopG/Arc/MetJ family transcriptional regulator
MERTTILIPGDLRQRLVDEARRRRVPQSKLIRDALESYLDETAPEPPRMVGVADVEGLDARNVKSWVREQWARKATDG